MAEIIPQERVFLDNWRLDLARLRDIPDSIEAEYADWTGATTFYLYDPTIRPELGPHLGHGQEEGEEDNETSSEVVDGQRPTYPEGRDYGPVFLAPREQVRPAQEQLEAATRHYPGGGVWDPWNGGRIEGEEQALRIRAEADRKKEEILAKAYKEAETTKGDGDAAAARVYGAAYSRNQSFYKLTRTLEAYRKALDEDTTVILSADSELLRLLSRGQ